MTKKDDVLPAARWGRCAFWFALFPQRFAGGTSTILGVGQFEGLLGLTGRRFRASTFPGT